MKKYSIIIERRIYVMKELEFYNKIKNWDFSMINYEKEVLTNWDMND